MFSTSSFAVTVLLALSAAVALAHGQESQPSALSVLSKYEAALGDPAVLAKVTSLRVKGKLAMPAAKDGIPFEERYLGEKTQLLMKVGKSLAPVQGSTGDWTWTSDSAMGVMIKEGIEQGAVKRVYAIQRLAPWRTIYEKAEVVGRKKLGESEAYELKMTGADQTTDTWWIGVKDSRLLAVDVVYPDFSGATMNMRWSYEDWKEANGVFYPMKRVQTIDLMTLPYVVESVEWNAAITPDDVRPPERIQKAFDDPKRKAAAADKAEFKIEELKAQPILSVRAWIKPDEVAKKIAEFYQEIGGYMHRSGADIAGPPMSRYHGEKDGLIDFEAGLPVSKALPGEGRVKGEELPAGRVATYVHVGPYDGLTAAHKKLNDWVLSQKLETTGALWESYVTDPGLVPNPKDWRTRLYRPVR